MGKIISWLKNNNVLFPVVYFAYSIFTMMKFIPLYFKETFYGVFYFRSLRISVTNHMTVGLKYLGQKKTVLPHPVGVVIGKKVRVGYNCKIYQNVTIGVRSESEEDYPLLGNNIIVYAGAVIVGNISIGDNSIIGANCMVTKSVPPNSVVVGNPMRIVIPSCNSSQLKNL